MLARLVQLPLSTAASTLVFLLVLAATAGAQAEKQIIVVMSDNAPVQSGSNVLGRLPRGLQLEVYRTQGSWQRVCVTADGELCDGWIEQRHTRPLASLGDNVPRIAGVPLKTELEVYYQYAMKLQSAGRLQDAVFPLKKAVELAEVVVPDGDDRITCVFNLGVLYERLAQYAAAEENYLAAYKLHQKLSGKPDSSYPLALGRISLKTGEYEKAERLIREALQMCTAAEGENSRGAGDCWHFLGVVYHDADRYAEAEVALLRALKIRENRLGPDHLDVADTLSTLGGMYVVMRVESKPEAMLSRAIAIFARHLDPHDLRQCYALHNLANFYSHLGEYEKAEPLMLRAIEIRRKQLSADHPLLAKSVNSLGAMYKNMNRLDEALPLLEESVRMAESRMEEDPLRVASYFNNLGLAQFQLDHYEEAARCLRRAIEIRREHAPEGEALARAINNLAALHAYLQEHDKAIELQSQSLAIREKVLSDAHPDISQSLHNLAMSFAMQQDWNGAAKNFDRSRRVTRRHVNQVLPSLSEQQQLSYLRKEDERFLHLAISLGCERREDPQLAALSAAWLLNGKGVVQEALAQRALLGRFSGEPEQQAAAAKLTEVRHTLAALNYRTFDTPEHQQQLQRDLERLRTKERALALKLNAAAGELGLAPWLELDELRRGMPENSVFVQIGRFEFKDFPRNRSHGKHYFAWLVFLQAESRVQLIDLGPAEEVEQAVAAARGAINAGGDAILKQGEPQAEQALQVPLNRLAQQILHPLLPHIKGCATWLISPDAALWLVPWSALPLPSGKYAVEDHAIRYLVSGRELAVGAVSIRTEPPVLLADPDYDLAADARRAQPEGNPSQRGLEEPAQFRSGSLILSAARLPGTAREAQVIAPFLADPQGGKPMILLRDKARESTVRELRSPRLMVLSTHGFFLDDELLAGAEGQLIENPLLRCGLLLAGCNDRTAATGIDDGILTGLEIVGTDLRGTELVVLSACETGLGEVRNGDGVAGLRQAFQLAGAESVVATLWQIPDRETAPLMGAFFQQLADKNSKSDALRAAQLSVIARRRERHGAAHPFFWAAFTVTGQDSER